MNEFDWDSYKSALAAHDWYFHMADDYRAFCDGMNNMEKLREAHKIALLYDKKRASRLWENKGKEKRGED